MSLLTDLGRAAATVAILAGGNSQRMGRDKAELTVAEGPGLGCAETWLERVCTIATTAGATAIVVGRERPKRWSNHTTHFFPDDTPNRGPLGGLATALRHAHSPVALVGCDMPRLTPQAFRWLLAQRAHPATPDGVATIAAGQLEPLFSTYSPSLLPLITERMERGDYSLRGLLRSGKFTLVDAPDWLPPQLAGVNTPQELEVWRGEHQQR